MKNVFMYLLTRHGQYTPKRTSNVREKTSNVQREVEAEMQWPKPPPPSRFSQKLIAWKLGKIFRVSLRRTSMKTKMK